MSAQTGFFSRRSALFSRRYRAALLDYLLGSGETGLLHAYALGRTAIDEGFGPLQILWAHHRAVNAVLESSHNANENNRLKAAEDFLMETLSPFEMTYRGYVALLKRDREKPPEERFSTWNGTERRRGIDRRVASMND
jgi:phosphoserine phosphatase RsbU-like protein